MSVSLRLTPELAKNIKQLAKEHHRSVHGEMLYGLTVYAADCKRVSVEKITSFWASQMSDGHFGESTPANLFKVIQENSAHPDKGFVYLEDCAYIDQTGINEQIRKRGAIIL